MMPRANFLCFAAGLCVFSFFLLLLLLLLFFPPRGKFSTVSANDPANNLNLLRAVGQASQYEAKLVVLEYTGAPQTPDKRTLLVGKGITFDTG